MNLVTHTLRILSPTGVPIKSIGDGGWLNLHYAFKECEPGVLELVLPGTFDFSFLPIDGIIEIYRKYGAMPTQLEGNTAFFIRRRLRSNYASQDGTRAISVIGESALALARRRVIPYFAGSSYTEKSAMPWDDMMREIMRENFGASATDTKGNNRSLDPYLTIESDISLGANADKSMSWKRILPVLQEIAADARANGEWASFDVIRTGDGRFEFRVFLGARGNDHSSTSSNPVILSEGARNLQDVSEDQDWQEEHNFVYATGQGQEETRNVQTAQDATRIGISPWNRQEYIQDARNGINADDSVQAEADAALEQGRPLVKYQGTISQTENCIYGVHWGFGDMITAQFVDELGNIVTKDCHVDSVDVEINKDGTEIATGHLRSEDDID